MKIKLLVIFILLLFLGLGVFVFFRYYYVFGEGVKSGELNYVVKKGYVFKTFEGKMIQSGFKSSQNMGSIQSNEFIFSIEDESTAKKLMNMGGRQIDVYYKEYFHPLPWRGNSEFVVDSFFVKLENITLDKLDINLYVGEKETLQASVFPEDASNKTINWTSSNSHIVSVSSDGEIIAKAPGKAVVYVSADNNKTSSCNIFVREKKQYEDENLPFTRGNTDPVELIDY